MSEVLSNEQFERLKALNTQAQDTDSQLAGFVEMVRQPLAARMDKLQTRWLISTIISGVLFVALIASLILLYLR